MTQTPISFSNPELAAVNEVLGAIGQSPVTALEFNNPEVFLVYQLLQQVLTDTLSEGWNFNSDFGFELTPDSDGRIIVPDKVLAIDGCNERVNRTTSYVQRGGYVYDKVNQTYTFEGPTLFDIIWNQDIGELPIPFRRYITAQASVRAAGEMVNNTELYKLLSQTSSTLRATIIEYECNSGDYTFFGNPPGTVYNSFQPYRALAR